MTLAKENFVTDAKGKKIAVLLPIKDYNKMLNDLEELEDVRLYDEVKARKEKSIPLEQYIKQRRKKRHA